MQWQPGHAWQHTEVDDQEPDFPAATASCWAPHAPSPPGWRRPLHRCPADRQGRDADQPKKYHVIMMVSFICRDYLDSSVKIFQHVLPLMFILHPWNHLKRKKCKDILNITQSLSLENNHLCVTWKRSSLTGDCGTHN